MEIKWSVKANYDLDDIEYYILKFFTYKEYDKFLDLLEQIIENIRTRKVVYQIYYDTFRKALISKQTSLIYEIKNEELHILRLINHFQDEDKKFVE